MNSLPSVIYRALRCAKCKLPFRVPVQDGEKLPTTCKECGK